MYAQVVIVETKFLGMVELRFDLSRAKVSVTKKNFSYFFFSFKTSRYFLLFIIVNSCLVLTKNTCVIEVNKKEKKWVLTK